MTKTFSELGFPGRLIAVEGLDGSGKSTQVHLLLKWLEQQGCRVFFSEWNSSALVKSATSKGKKQNLLTPTSHGMVQGVPVDFHAPKISTPCGTNFAFADKPRL